MDLATYYRQLPSEGGLVSACHMALGTADLRGKRILDVGCRRGKGAYQLSEAAGPEGFVLGVDWRPAFVEQAQEGVKAALARSGLLVCNLAFRVAYPENLRDAGIEDGSFDVAYLNNGVTLLCDPVEALRECARALTPDGVLLLEAVVTDTPQGAALRQQARAAGSSVGAALTEEDMRTWLCDAGFSEVAVAECVEVDPARDNFEPDARPGSEPARFFALTFQARKACES